MPSTFAGVFTGSGLFGTANPVPSLSAPAPDAWLASLPIDGVKTGNGVVSVSHPPVRNGQLSRSHNTELVNKVIVVPRIKALGFIFSDTNFTAEVWNNYSSARELNSFSIVGGTGILVSSAYTLPKSMPTSASWIFNITAEIDGSPVIHNTVTWNFSDAAGADLIITGTRLVPFSIAPDWGQGIVEGYGYVSSVLQSYDGTEQRMELTSVPTRDVDFSTITENAADAAYLSALLYNWQSRIYGVPIWMDATKSSATVSPGDLVIHVDTTQMDLSGGAVLLWTDARHWEAFQIDSYTSSTITSTSVASGSWPSGTVVLPLRYGRLDLQQPIKPLTPELFTLSVKFSMELV